MTAEGKAFREALLEAERIIDNSDFISSVEVNEKTMTLTINSAVSRVANAMNQFLNSTHPIVIPGEMQLLAALAKLGIQGQQNDDAGPTAQIVSEYTRKRFTKMEWKISRKMNLREFMSKYGELKESEVWENCDLLLPELMVKNKKATFSDDFRKRLETIASIT